MSGYVHANIFALFQKQETQNSAQLLIQIRNSIPFTYLFLNPVPFANDCLGKQSDISIVNAKCPK